MFIWKIYSKLVRSYWTFVKVAILDAQSKDPSLFTQFVASPKRLKKKHSLNTSLKKYYKKNIDNSSLKEKEIDAIDDFFELETLFQIKNSYINFEKVLSLVDEHYGGNICFVKMNEADIKGSIVGTPHEYRPFVSLEEKKDGCSGFYMTSNLENIEFWKSFFAKYKTILLTEKYDLYKSSLILLNKLVYLDRGSIVKYIDFLDDADLIRILKMAVLYRGNSLDIEGKYIDCGDIVEKEKNKYLIYNQDQDLSYGLKIKLCDTEEKSKVDVSQDFYHFSLDHNIYRIYYNRNIRVSDLDHVVLQEHITNTDLMLVYQKREEYFQKVMKR